MLRGAGEDEIEFAHNTLKAFLAAQHYLNAGEAAPLARRMVQADLEELRSGLDEVAVFCAASPTGRRFASLLINGLSREAERLAPRDAERARWLRMLSLRCEAAAGRLGTRKRKDIQKFAAEVFPPRDMEEARQLAALGEDAIPRLAPTADAADEEAAACVRCLRLIGPTADAAIDAYRDFEAPVVLEELAQVRHPLTLAAVVAAAQDYEKWDRIPDGVKSRIIEVEPLAGLTNLRTLILDDTQVADVGPLAGLTNLQTLKLYNTQVADVGPLAGLTNLQTLYLYNTQLSDVDPLAGLTKLQSLILSDTQVSDVDPLAGLSNLQSLYLYGTQVSDVGPLAGLTNLQTLSLANTQLSDVGPLAGLSNLQELRLNGTPLSEVGPLAGLSNLRSLWLDNTQVSELGPLAGLTNLKELRLGGTQVTEEQVARLREALPELQVNPMLL